MNVLTKNKPTFSRCISTHDFPCRTTHRGTEGATHADLISPASAVSRKEWMALAHAEMATAFFSLKDTKSVTSFSVHQDSEQMFDAFHTKQIPALKKLELSPDLYADLKWDLHHAHMSDFTVIILVAGFGCEGSGVYFPGLCAEGTCIPDISDPGPVMYTSLTHGTVSFPAALYHSSLSGNTGCCKMAVFFTIPLVRATQRAFHVFNVRQGRVGAQRLMPNAVQILAAGPKRRAFFRDMRGAVRTSVGFNCYPLFHPLRASHVPQSQGRDRLVYPSRPADALFLDEWGVGLLLPS
jgi:hypothetical protein